MHAIGIVLNPKLKQPVLVVTDAYDEIDIHVLREGIGRVGSGTFEVSDESYLAPAKATGMPRVHTARGVTRKGQGYGTCLYTGLCLGAHLHHERDLRMAYDQEGDGISSGEETRSGEASIWWDRAVDLDLANHLTIEHTEEDVEFDYGDLSDCEDRDGQEVEITWARGDVTKELDVDVYPYDQADDANLILATFHVELDDDVEDEGLRQLWKEMLDDDGYEVEDVYIDRILACDVRYLAPESVNLLSTLLQLGDADEDDIDAMQLRAKLKLDPATPVPQLRLPFKPNPSDEEALEAINAATAELRSEMGWERLADLP